MSSTLRTRSTAIFVSFLMVLVGFKLLTGFGSFNVNLNNLADQPSRSWSTYGNMLQSAGSVKSDSQGFIPSGPELESYCERYRWRPYPDRYHRRKIYDLTLINTELDWLEIRLGQMSSQVDYFVIVESALTFSDTVKPLFVQENYSRFSKYHSKMIVHTLNLTGQTFPDAWARETFNRNAMFDQVFPTLTGEHTPQHGDVIIVGDVDELIRPSVLTALRNCAFPQRVRLWTKIYYYSFQWLSSGQGRGDWNHPDVTFFSGLHDTPLPQPLRDNPTDGDAAEVWNAGWHCSFCFSRLAEMVRKVQSYSHQEMNRPDFLDPLAIAHRVRVGLDIFHRPGSDCRRVEFNADVPDYLLLHRDKYAYMFDRDGDDAGFEDYWDVVDEAEGVQKREGEGGGEGAEAEAPR